MNKIAAMLNAGPKNAKLFRRGANALNQDGSNVGSSGEHNVQQQQQQQHTPETVPTHAQHQPPQLPPGFPGNIPGTSLMHRKSC